jgi:Tfp pilus assembly protein PilF
LEPKFVDAHAELATALLTKGDVKQAEAHYLAAMQVNPNRADIHTNFGSLLLKEGRTSQAILEYEEALRIDPTLTEVAEILQAAKQSDSRFQSHVPK